MTAPSGLEGHAIVYCEGAFGTTNGKTAHGLVRRSRAVPRAVGRRLAPRRQRRRRGARRPPGRHPGRRPISRQAVDAAVAAGRPADPLRRRPRAGRRPPRRRPRERTSGAPSRSVSTSTRGLHDFLVGGRRRSPRWRRDAASRSATSANRRPRRELHFFSGKIAEVDSAQSRRARDRLGGRQADHGLAARRRARGARPACGELVGTGQTAWLQGARYGIILDSLVNDFVAGEIEHAVWTRWTREPPRGDRPRGPGQPA